MKNLHASPQHFFSKVASANIQRSSFDRSHNNKFTYSAGYLVPFYYDEVLPGDTFNVHHSIYTRLIAPLDVPMMDNLHIDTFYFYVPNRLVWDHWRAFMGEKRRPTDSTDYVTPKININQSIGINSIYDYFGVPYGVSGFKVLALPFRAYNLIYNEWFRAESLIDLAPEDFSSDGDDPMTDYRLLKRGKRFDYFTSALPEPQSGDPVDIPLGISAPVVGNGHALQFSQNGVAGGIYATVHGTNVNPDGLGLHTNTSLKYIGLPNSAGPNNLLSDGFLGIPSNKSYDSGMVVDLTSATPASISTLRQAFQLQAFNEISARGGNRYTEILYSHFGVISPDSRLQRPEYLGGSHDILNMSVVPQTSGSTSSSKQANLSAYMYGSSVKNGFTKSFVEHGFIIGLMCVYADLTYQQGLNRMLSRDTKLDYYWREFANLSDQAILNKEIYTQGTSADDEVFGYQERYAEYKYYPNMICGELRSTYSEPLDYWHLAQKFGNLPTLNQTFIEENPPIDRITGVTDEVQFIADVKVSCNCVRPMPLYNDPMHWMNRG